MEGFRRWRCELLVNADSIADWWMDPITRMVGSVQVVGYCSIYRVVFWMLYILLMVSLTPLHTKGRGWTLGIITEWQHISNQFYDINKSTQREKSLSKKVCRPRFVWYLLLWRLSIYITVFLYGLSIIWDWTRSSPLYIRLDVLYIHGVISKQSIDLSEMLYYFPLNLRSSW